MRRITVYGRQALRHRRNVVHIDRMYAGRRRRGGSLSNSQMIFRANPEQGVCRKVGEITTTGSSPEISSEIY